MSLLVGVNILIVFSMGFMCRGNNPAHNPRKTDNCHFPTRILVQNKQHTTYIFLGKAEKKHYIRLF